MPIRKKSRVSPGAIERHDSQVTRLQAIWALMERAYDEVEQWVAVEILPGFKEYPKFTALNDLVRMEIRIGVSGHDASAVNTPVTPMSPMIRVGGLQAAIAEGDEEDEKENNENEGDGEQVREDVDTDSGAIKEIESGMAPKPPPCS